MPVSPQNIVTLTPDQPEAHPKTLERIRNSFAEHLILDRGTNPDDAKRQAAEMLSRAVSFSRSKPQDFMLIRQNGTPLGVLWKTERMIDGAQIWHVLYIEILHPFRGKGIAMPL